MFEAILLISSGRLLFCERRWLIFERGGQPKIESLVFGAQRRWTKFYGKKGKSLQFSPMHGDWSAVPRRDNFAGFVFSAEDNAWFFCGILKDILFFWHDVLCLEMEVHLSYEVLLQLTLLYHPLTIGEDSVLDSKLILSENGRGVSNFRLTIYKQSDDSHLRDELWYLTRVYQPQRSRCFLPSFDCVQILIDKHHVWSGGKNVFHEVSDVTNEKFFDPAFVDQETARDTFVAQLCRYYVHGRTCNACLQFRHT
ncbi:hypothetical protein TNCV_55821 [Trichonephila clavipes]|nr:hypothetical protein TNCV_55821 [Trichonephila clavipes]